jgi:hypothetical protein
MRIYHERRTLSIAERLNRLLQVYRQELRQPMWLAAGHRSTQSPRTTQTSR